VSEFVLRIDEAVGLDFATFFEREHVRLGRAIYLLTGDPAEAAVLHFDGSSWRRIDLPTSPGRVVVPKTVTVVRPGDVWVGGWTASPGDADDLDEIRPFVSHWTGKEWVTEDHGVDSDGSMITGSATDGESVWFVGRQGGAYARHNAWLVGARPLVLVARCR
jgi:hypothetical protein